MRTSSFTLAFWGYRGSYNVLSESVGFVPEVVDLGVLFLDVGLGLAREAFSVGFCICQVFLVLTEFDIGIVVAVLLLT